jgi:hypothetical protein
LNCIEFSASAGFRSSPQTSRWDERRKGRRGKRVGNADDQGQDNDHPDFDPSHGDKRDDNDGTEHLDTLKEIDDPGPVSSIGEDAAQKHQYPERRIHRKSVETEKKRRASDAQQQPGFSHRLHPGSDVGKKTGKPENSESSGSQ